MRTSTVTLSFGFASLVFAALACSSSSDGAGGGDTTSPKDDGGVVAPGSDASVEVDSSVPNGSTFIGSCETLASALCAKIQSCSAFGLAAIYGDLATCQVRSTLACTTSASATGQMATPQSLTECAGSVTALTCAQAIAFQGGEKCLVPGKLKDGAACGYGGQCESTFCALAPDKSCGTCAALTKEGDACVNGACSAGTACGEDDSKCHAPGTGKPGDSCTRFADCDLANASACNTVGKKCVAVDLSQDGKCGPDNLLVPTKFTACPASGNCSSLLGGTCGAIAREGEECSSTGANCLPPAHCVAGRCELPSATCQ